MREYDVLFIIKANLGEEVEKGLVSQFEDIVSKNEGEILKVETLGRRELATPIGHDTLGVFVNAQFNATEKTLEELQLFFRVTENILRDMVVTMDSIRMGDQEEVEA